MSRATVRGALALLEMLAIALLIAAAYFAHTYHSAAVYWHSQAKIQGARADILAKYRNTHVDELGRAFRFDTHLLGPVEFPPDSFTRSSYGPIEIAILNKDPFEIRDYFGMAFYFDSDSKLCNVFPYKP